MALAILELVDLGDLSARFRVDTGTSPWFTLRIGRRTATRDGFAQVEELMLETPLRQNPRAGLLDTATAERKMFARQVFGFGAAAGSDETLANLEFPSLWKVLVLESAQYLQYARESFNADAYVSRQGVMQAVEDLQYNLSTHCTGMATVITPLIDAELQFVGRRILMHPEVRSQVVPAGGSWKRVIEQLVLEARHRSFNATVLYNKAKLGQLIIDAVADYDPADFEADGPFSAFISTVDRFITTQSILQKDRDRAEGGADAPEPPPSDGPLDRAPISWGGHEVPTPVGAGAYANGNGNGNGAHPSAAPDEWDF